MWYWHIILFIIGYPLSVLFHELSHAIYVWYKGGFVHRFKFWPHREWPGHGGNKIVVGEVVYFAPDNFNEKINCLIPLIAASILFSIYIISSIFWMPMIMLAFWEVKEFCVFIKNLVYGDIGTDGGDYGIMMTENIQ